MSRRVALLVVLVAGAAGAARAQTCPSPAYEKRLNAAVEKNEPALNTIPAARARAFALCNARRICGAGLDKTEFEMYVLDVLNSYGDEAAEKEFGRRMKRDGKKHLSGSDKVGAPNALRDACKKEVGG